MKNIYKNLILLLITLIIIFIIIEILLRILFPRPLNFFDLDEELNRKPLKNFETIYQRSEFTTPIELSSEGLRDHEFSLEKDPETYRIISLGDSFAFGLSVEKNESYAKLLESKLKGKKVEVINMGLPGYGNGQELIFFEKYGLKYKPDMVILGFYPNNDVIDNLVNKKFIFENGTLIKNPEKIKFSTWIKVKNFLSRKLHTYSFVHKVIRQNDNVSKILKKIGLVSKVNEEETRNLFFTDFYLREDSNESKQAWKMTEAILGKFIKLSKEEGFEFVIFFIPSKQQVNEDKLILFLKENKLEGKELDVFKQQRRIANFIGEYDGIILIDPTKEFISKDTNNTFYWEIDGHWNGEGHKLAAEILYENLKNKIQ